MPAPTVTVASPPPANYFDPGTLRPQARVAWTGGTGPFDVLHEWDTDPLFGSGSLIQVTNVGATSIDSAVPTADLGPAGTTWYYRVTVTDTSDMASTTSSNFTLNWSDPQDFRRYLYLLGNVGVAFYPTDTAVLAEAVDGDVQEFRRYLYLLANVDTSTPTPHIWYLVPTFGREGWEFKIVGYGFGDTQGTYSGSVTLSGLAVGIISWQLVAESSPNLTIDALADIAEPVHQEIRAVVPDNAESGPVIVCTDGP